MRTLICLNCLEDFKVKNDDPDFAYCDICETELSDEWCDDED